MLITNMPQGKESGVNIIDELNSALNEARPNSEGVEEKIKRILNAYNESAGYRALFLINQGRDGEYLRENGDYIDDYRIKWCPENKPDITDVVGREVTQIRVLRNLDLEPKKIEEFKSQDVVFDLTEEEIKSRIEQGILALADSIRKIRETV